MFEYLLALIAAIISVFHLGGFIYFYPSDKKILEEMQGSKKALAVDVLYVLFFVGCLVLAIYIYTIINQQLIQYSR
ncbi:hypothetical protein EGCR1_17540 (plasmid) [Enterococcus gilvus]|jgi:hypothetical protein|uniref:hypothetical protein n=1 Tax=Enterococcus gilvus TaxID=160453 RepID=UPI000DF5CED6|nr:hypothetical protein [Enterococcus gilvus]AXG40504.1 hypothetical protein EGCR1_17540 [Enterococcus gilvus]